MSAKAVAGLVPALTGRNPASTLQSMVSLGTRFREARLAAGLKQADVARALAKSKQYISQLERGDVKPSQATAEMMETLIAEKFASVRTVGAGVLSPNPDRLPAERLGSHEFRDLLEQLPSGTKVFVITALGLVEATDERKLAALLRRIAKQKGNDLSLRDEYHYCIPDESYVNDQTTAEVRSRYEKTVQDLDVVEKQLQASPDVKEVHSAVVKTHKLPIHQQHLFHPLVKTIIFIPPIHIADDHDEADVRWGFLEFEGRGDTYYVRLDDDAVDEAIAIMRRYALPVESKIVASTQE